MATGSPQSPWDYAESLDSDDRIEFDGLRKSLFVEAFAASYRSLIRNSVLSPEQVKTLAKTADEHASAAAVVFWTSRS